MTGSHTMAGPKGHWVKVEFYGLLPAGQDLPDTDLQAFDISGGCTW